MRRELLGGLFGLVAFGGLQAQTVEPDGIALAGATPDAVPPQEVSFDYGAVERALTATPGDPEAGRQVFVDRKLGNCLACHVNAQIEEQPFHGEIGPPLDGVGERWSEAELRGIVTNPKQMFEGTIMPAFYRPDAGARVAEAFKGETILTAQQVEDVVAYLQTLKE
jgi:sulfur-oxidizing protein SoxX